MTGPDTGPAPAVTAPPGWLTSNAWAVIDVVAQGGRGEPVYGTQICQVTGLGQGTVHPILVHLIEAGWVQSWIDPAHQGDLPGQPRRPGGPPRRYYRLADAGRTATAELAPRPAPPAGVQNPPLFRGGMTKRAVT